MTFMLNHTKFLNRSDDISIHQKQLSITLAIEVYESLTKWNPWFMWSFFERNHIPYNLRRGDLLLLLPAKFTRYGVKSLAFRGSLLWNNIQSQVKESQTLEEFKNGIKNLSSLYLDCLSVTLMLLYSNLIFFLVFMTCFYDCECFYLSDTNL